MLKEFKEFAMRGSVIDLAIGVIIGAAFGQIVASLVSDILMPPIGLLLGNVDFSDLFINLSDAEHASLAAAKVAGAPTINYGVFINTVIHFLIVAFAIFLVVKQINKLQRKPQASSDAPSTKECVYCASSIGVKATRCPYCTSDLKSGVTIA